ncbi:dihydroorotate oxidase B, electron transfer subunit [Caldanaerobius fijiensis DSM 17918]|uniref:Dihydroorotate dehydrogenase B (NAD(+)), electron transfer subunit n=1 Tax=Caldanaerobius fijiensis DSM 17918 TaxID=1121256 RepID=A0A1M4TT18_9THEO|nr:dihydroorotate dehydrogenase electron transfer subunit [Caldanaerobius fijiensis]SHE47649.1 dihydroorotate oxidase B, electron transfer subunit [Caldanaerobius fijiensis DSM 17918]
MKSSILFNRLLAPGIYQMAFSCADIARSASPGQFVHIKLNDSGHILRRPFSISNIIGDIVYIVYQVRGSGTLIISRLKSGDEIDVIGPLGRGFDISRTKNRALIVGGGLGIAPLLYLSRMLSNKSEVFLGYKDHLFLVEEFEHPIVSTETGISGYRGFVTDALKEYLESSPMADIIYACGPVGMLKAVKSISQHYGIPCQVSLEERMGCGIGACLVCSCKIKAEDGWHYMRVCADGPVFMADEVIFDD